MKKFRVANCLNDSVNAVGEFAIFEDGSERKPIFIDHDGHKYFHVDNELNKDCHNLLAKSFSNRIKDAVDTIIAGNGDVISIYNTIGEHINVFYYLDREYGESLRKRTIEGWKDTKFGYIIKYGSNRSFSGYCNILGTDYSPVYSTDSKRVFYFDTYDEAKEEIQKIIDKAYNYAKQIDDEVSKNKSISVYDVGIRVCDRMKADDNLALDSIIMDFTFDMLNEDGIFRHPDDPKKLFAYGYRIVQYPLPEEEKETMIKIKCISVPDIPSNIDIGKEYWMLKNERDCEYINVYKSNNRCIENRIGNYKRYRFEIMEG